MGSGVSAVIVAAGSASRMGRDKIFLKLCGREVILYSLEKFQNNSLVDEIILVISGTNKKAAEKLCGDNFSKLKKIVIGGENRSQSVLNGIMCTSPQCDYLLIHDGARPLVSDKIITDCIKDGKKYNAATAAIPVTDTIKTITDGVITGTPNRRSLVAVQTPQVFNKKLYLQCADRLKGESFTDDCQLFELSGYEVHITQGEKINLKLTSSVDIIEAEAYLREKSKICE